MHALEEHTLSLPTWNQRANDSREAGRGDLPGALQSPKSQLRLDEPPGEKEGLRQGGQAGRDGCKKGLPWCDFRMSTASAQQACEAAWEPRSAAPWVSRLPARHEGACQQLGVRSTRHIRNVPAPISRGEEQAWGCGFKGRQRQCTHVHGQGLEFLHLP